MDIHQLELFLAVMDSASVTKAAARMRLSPGAVSIQLHALADELHTELFRRCGKRLMPTPSAFRLAELSNALVRQVAQIREQFENDPVSDTRPFHFATGVTTLIYRLGPALRKVRKQFPQAEIHVTVGVTEQIVSGLLEGKFDLGLISLPVAEEQLSIMPLFEEELLVLRPSTTVVRGGHVGSISASDLTSVPFLLYPKQSNMRSIIDQFFREIGLTPKVVMEADDTEAIKRLVEAGFGYSILPEHALRGRQRFYHTLRIKRHRLMRRQALATARSQYPRRLTQAVADFLLGQLGTGEEATPAL
ncbi:MAG TPA: LysR family transcriptional regulator [Candidatus Angelobacter sp.]|nr:LysR family transcriptional regulator [Candidatus Angelobacter sp.]